MLLQLLSQRNGVKVIEGVDRLPEVLVVLLIDQHLVQGLVNRFVVVGLDGAQVRFDQLEVAEAGKERDSTGMV